jgi:sulfide:quinone oxidoreductase
MKKILILGAGFGGLETATSLGAALGDDHEITLIDKNDSFFVGFSKIDVLFGRRSEAEVRMRYADLRADNVRFVQAAVTAIDTHARVVATSVDRFSYDYLVVALGADLDPDATPGFRDSGGHEFYSMAGTVRLRPVVEAFHAGTLVIGALGPVYKCPPAPFEVAYQLHELYLEKGVRERIHLKIVIPGARPVGNPAAAEGLERLCAERGIELRAGSPIKSIDAPHRQVVLAGGTLGYDLFIGVPVHVPPPVVRASGLADQGFVAVSAASLETKVPNVYAVGDVTRIPVGEAAVPKAGAFAEDAARTVVSDILVKEGRAAETVKFRAQGTCYFELGGGLVGKIVADYFGGEKPKMALEGPSVEHHADKVAFETTRRARWFKQRS